MDKNQPTTAHLAAKFMASFTENRTNLSSQIQNLLETGSSSDSGAISEKLTGISNEIQQLSKTLHDATMFLPSYSIKVRQNEIRDLEKALKDAEDLLIPKKKFGFRNKQAENSSAVDGPAADIKPKLVPTVPMSDNMNCENFVTIENLSGITKVYYEDELNGFDVLARDLENVTLHLVGNPSTLRIKNVKNSLILCGPISTSVFVDSVIDSQLFLSCKQLRTHCSNRTDIYLRVLSRAIIEDCENIRFAPYFWNNSKAEELHQKAEIPHTLERFDAVDDFNWLSAAHSPNWSIIPENERIQFPDIE